MGTLARSRVIAGHSSASSRMGSSTCERTEPTPVYFFGSFSVCLTLCCRLRHAVDGRGRTHDEREAIRAPSLLNEVIRAHRYLRRYASVLVRAQVLDLYFLENNFRRSATKRASKASLDDLLAVSIRSVTSHSTAGFPGLAAHDVETSGTAPSI